MKLVVGEVPGIKEDLKADILWYLRFARIS
jgi:hypothetical protein